MAEAIKLQIPQADIFSVSEIQNMEKTEKYDLIFIGGWIDRGTFDTGALKTAELIKNKKTAYFFTLGAYPDSDHAKNCVKNIDTLLEKIQTKFWEDFFVRGQ